jgi:hypothetical protein
MAFLCCSCRCLAVQLFCPRAKSNTTHACNHWLCCGEMMAGVIEAEMRAAI